MGGVDVVASAVCVRGAVKIPVAALRVLGDWPKPKLRPRDMRLAQLQYAIDGIEGHGKGLRG
jgi:hypothetical protein